METKFIKGEWKISSEGEYLEIIADDTEFICDLGEEYVAFEEEYANAKLIAAAPDLLEACVYLVRLKDLVLPPEPVKGVSEEFMSEFIALNNLIKMADSAIKKATE